MKVPQIEGLPQLDGRKKFTATVLTLLIGLVGLLVTSGLITEATADTITQILSMAIPLLVVTGYNIYQGKQDIKKEEVKIADIKRSEKPKIEDEERIATNPSPEPGLETAPLDMTALMAVAEKAAVNYGGGESALWRGYRDAMAKTSCFYLGHAQTAWDKAAELAQLAFKQEAGFNIQEAHEHLDDGGACPYVSVDSMARQLGYYTLLEDVRMCIRVVNDLDALAREPVDLVEKFKGTTPTLYAVGVHADEIMGEHVDIISRPDYQDFEGGIIG